MELGILSGRHSTASSSISTDSLMAKLALPSSTSQLSVTARENNVTGQTIKVIAIPLSFAA